MKTRSRKAHVSKTGEVEANTKTVHPSLEPSIQDPPQVFIWPEETSPHARVVTLPHPATSIPSRYLLCPDRGCFEFVKIAAPRQTCRSWLLAPDTEDPVDGNAEQEHPTAYVLQTPHLMVATPVDPLFLLLPALDQTSGDGKRMYLTPLDYLERLESRSDHLKQTLRQDPSGRLEKVFESSMLSVCDTMQAGGEALCRFSREKLVEKLVDKAQRMVKNGLPASLEERFVKQVLAVPVMCTRREESGISLVDGDGAGPGAESESASTSLDTEGSDTTAESASTTATSVTTTTASGAGTATPEVMHLLRMRTALQYLVASYVPPAIASSLEAPLMTGLGKSCPLNFHPLDEHLSRLKQLKQEAQALRSLSDNISRKREAMDDDEAIEKAEAKKRKKEEEEARKKNVSQGVKKLAKADRSGMKSISSFFGAKAPTGGKK